MSTFSVRRGRNKRQFSSLPLNILLKPLNSSTLVSGITRIFKLLQNIYKLFVHFLSTRAELAFIRASLLRRSDHSFENALRGVKI